MDYRFLYSARKKRLRVELHKPLSPQVFHQNFNGTFFLGELCYRCVFCTMFFKCDQMTAMCWIISENKAKNNIKNIQIQIVCTPFCYGQMSFSFVMWHSWRQWFVEFDRVTRNIPIIYVFYCFPLSPLMTTSVFFNTISRCMAANEELQTFTACW